MLITLCRRCEQPIPSNQIECDDCLAAAEHVWPGIGPIAGEVSGA